jgi:hypothetical protein
MSNKYKFEVKHNTPTNKYIKDNRISNMYPNINFDIYIYDNKTNDLIFYLKSIIQCYYYECATNECRILNIDLIEKSEDITVNKIHMLLKEMNNNIDFINVSFEDTILSFYGSDVLDLIIKKI